MQLSKLPKMPAARLTKEIESATAAMFSLVDEMIEAGRGRELPTETMAKAELPDADDLTLRYASNARLRLALFAERDARLKFHGSLKPMP